MTLNMGTFKVNIVHQIIADADASSCKSLCDLMNDADFIVVEQYYNMSEEHVRVQDWQYKGEIVINTAHIGKVQQYMEFSNSPSETKKSFR